MKNTIEMYNGKVYGEAVSGYGLDNGYLDYRTLAKILGDLILNNTIMSETYPEDWELVNGCDCDGEIYQFYIISEYGYEFLSEHTDEIVYYNNTLDIHLWGVTHFGTSWDYVLTDIELIKL